MDLGGKQGRIADLRNFTVLKQVKNKKLSLKTTKYAVDKQVTLEIFSNGVLSLQMIGTYPGQISTFQRILSEIGPPPKN